MSRSMRITFILPRPGHPPSGGLRVVYQYANHLSRKGHLVTVVSPPRPSIDARGLDHIKGAVRYLQLKVNGRYKPDSWLRMDPKVRLICAPSLSSRFIPDGDAVVATAWQTVEWVGRYPPSKGNRFYLIQHLETWNGPEERVLATWRAPLQKIVISRWLHGVAESLGQVALYIPNGLDTDQFSLVVPPRDRMPDHLMMLYHTAQWKGSEDGLRAIEIVRREMEALRVTLYGVPPRPVSLPRWIAYHQTPSPDALRDLYNQAAIFVAPSRTEGWGLPACEAMLSGAALVATDIDGHREFAFHEDTALTSPGGSPAGMAQNILRLIRDPALRIDLAGRGHRFVRQFTWDRAADRLEAALLARA